jgi:hypothetical protein
LNQINDEHDHRDYEQDVNEAAHRVGADQSEQPKHEQNDKYSPEHGDSFLLRLLPYFAAHRAIALI